ncbi:MAG: PQQ-binding-like beta-propeller repeat protein [Acidimicrobiales bacterium]
MTERPRVSSSLLVALPWWARVWDMVNVPLALLSMFAVVAAVLVPGTVAQARARHAGPVATNWTTYHANPLESGIAPSTATFAHPKLDWTSPSLDGQLYGEPLVEGGLVVVATENDVVYGLSATNGSVAWSTSVGSPVPAGSLPCGDISPNVGITSTPVIDSARSEVFVVADEVSDSAISHHLVGLGLSTGNIVLDQVVDPPGTLTAAQLQRPGLTLDQGAVEIAFGGNAGDCSTYHGWVVSVPESGGAMRTWEADASPGDDEGAVWLGGAAPVVDSGGNIWFATGNGSNTTGPSPDGGDSVIELSSSLVPLQSFTPSTWQTDNADDFDLGSSPPALMGNGLVFMAGKSRTAYLLKESKLGGVGGEVTEQPFCGTNVDGGEAFTTKVVYAPCLAGVQAVRVNTRNHKLHVLWSTSTGSSGPPIVAGNKVWTIRQDGTLFGLRKSNGKVVVQLTVGAPSNHFPTPAVGDGLLLAASSNRVVAFH